MKRLFGGVLLELEEQNKCEVYGNYLDWRGLFRNGLIFELCMKGMCLLILTSYLFFIE